MPRPGGGHEDFEKELAIIAEVKRGRKELASTEAAARGDVEALAASEKRSADASRLAAGVKRESADVAERASRATKDTTKALDLDTAAVKRNTEARSRANQSRAMSERAVYGARSPQYGQAHQLYQESGEIPSQYRLRQIPGVGQRRAAAMVQAMQAGLTPSTGQVDVNRPLARMAAAHEEVAASEYRLAQATKEHERIKRAGTQDEAQASYATRQDAKSQLQSARRELQDSEEQHAARVESIRAEEQNRAALHKEILDRGRANPIVDPRRALPAPGQTVQGMEVGRAETRTLAQVGLRHPDTGALPTEQTVKTMHVERLALPPAGGTTQGMPVYPAETRTRVTIPGAPAAAQAAPPNWAAGDPERVAALAQAEKFQRVLASQAAAQERVTQANREAGASFYPLSQAMHRHGALTSEFIAAAARGETTLRELGNQAIITAGKFGGWTIAATAVYGVVGALGKVAQGAMDASSGADQAFRVITQNRNRDQIQGNFADLSKTFNVPIATASDAVYKMGQVFHNQPDAIKAAEAALLSYKTGEVSVDESTRNLIAIQQAFGLSSTGLVGIFDQINAAQNKFGISIGDTEAGLAKAGGTWRNAGGDLDYLLGLFVAIQKATGRTGQEIGTSLSRLYYVQHPQSALNLRKLGVDVDLDNVQKTYQSAMKRAQQPGADIHGIAAGLVGPQYARNLEAVLRNQTTLNKALAETNGEAAKGSGMKELHQVLHQVDEQITALGNNFQRLGAALARGGAFNWAGLLLRTLNGVLGTATAIVNIFNLLPSPIRSALSMMAELVIAMMALRRIGATERLVNSPLGFLADPVGRQRTHTIVGLRQGQQEAYNRTERYGQINVDRGFEAELARRQANEAAQHATTFGHLDVQNPERMKVEAEALAAERKAIAAESALALSTANLDHARQISTAAEEELTLAQNTSKRKFLATASQRNWVYPHELDQPNMAGIGRAGVVPGVGPGGTVPVGVAGAGAVEAEAAATRTARVAAEIELQSGRLAGALGALGGSGVIVGRSATALQGATLKAGTGMANATNSVSKAALGFRSFGGAFTGMLAALGPLDLLLVGLLVLVPAEEAILKRLTDHANATRNALEKATPTQVDVQTQLAEANRVLKAHADQTPTPSQLAGQTPSPNLFHPIRTFQNFKSSVSGAWDGVTGVSKAAQDAQDVVAARLEAQANAQRQGKPIPQLTYDQLIKNIEHDSELRKQGLISQAEMDSRLSKHAIEAKTLLDADAAAVEKARQAQADAARASAGISYDKALAAMSPDDFAKEEQGTGAAVDLYGLTPHNMDYLQRQYKAAEEKFRNSNKPDDLIALNTARNNYFSAVTQEVQKELQLNLLQANTEQERRAAYAQASQQYDEMRVKFTQQNSRMRATQQKQQDDLRRKQQIEDRGGSRHQMGINDKDDPQAGNAPVLTDDQKTEREDRQRKDRIKLTRDQKKKMDAELARQNRELTLAALQMKQAAYDDRQQGREILLNLQISGTQDPLRQAQLRIETARRQVADAQKQWGEQSRQYRQALTDLRNAQTAQAQAILAGVQADDAVLLAQAGGDPVAQAKVEAENAQRELDAMRKSGADPNAIKQQKAQLINSKRAAKDAADQQLQDLARLRAELASARAGDDPVAAARGAVEAAKLAQKVADTPTERLQALVDLTKANNDLQAALVQREMDRFDLMKSETDDPVKQAKIDLEAAKYALAHSKGTDKVKKQTDYNNAKKQYQDAKISDSEDTINFEYQMDQITADEAAKQLEALANLKGISKAKKRELLLQAKQLRDEASGDYELDVGDIRLPSLYEVRRFVTAGQPQASQVTTDNRNFTVYLGTAEAVDAFAQQLEITNGTAATATARSMKMR